jgi:DNA-binding NarL/FixJ family response regulator
MIRVLVADDQAVVRDGLVLLLSTSTELDVVGAAVDGTEAVRLVRELAPDVLLCDLRMPGLDGAQVTAEVAGETRVLVLTTYADDDAVLPALRAGAAGYLTKDATGEELVAAILEVAAGRTVLDESVQRRLVELLRAPGAAPAPPGAPPVESLPVRSRPIKSQPFESPVEGGLTRREVDVVRLVAEGLSNPQIARRLVLSEATVKTHLNHLLSKLDVDGRPGLVAWAWRHGFGSP